MKMKKLMRSRSGMVVWASVDLAHSRGHAWVSKHTVVDFWSHASAWEVTLDGRSLTCDARGGGAMARNGVRFTWVSGFPCCGIAIFFLQSTTDNGGCCGRCHSHRSLLSPVHLRRRPLHWLVVPVLGVWLWLCLLLTWKRTKGLSGSSAGSSPSRLVSASFRVERPSALLEFLGERPVLAHSSTHPLIRSPSHPLIHSLTHPLSTHSTQGAS